jgi:pimeloyl-ACP methyl ester carboxylesterase
MEIIIQPSQEAAAVLVARIVARELRANPRLVPGLAAGKTMECVYRLRVRLHPRRVKPQVVRHSREQFTAHVSDDSLPGRAPESSGSDGIGAGWGRQVPNLRENNELDPMPVLCNTGQGMTEKLQMRIHGDGCLPTLIYLPGLHGDWTLVGSFRRALGGRVRFVEFTYPRTRTWSLDEYAEAIETALPEQRIKRGWLLGESYGSQVLWSIIARNKFQAEGVILAGGFVQHPLRWGVRLAERLAGGIPLTLLTRIIFGYAKVARFRYRRSPETLANIQEFIARRTELDRQAAVHRLRLIALNDPRPIAREVNVPVYALTGILDPVVPWCCVRPWLKRNCPSLRQYKIVWRADHNVLGTAAQAAAEQVLRWMSPHEPAGPAATWLPSARPAPPRPTPFRSDQT